jgi:CRISPR system Cascade subunit CasE
MIAGVLRLSRADIAKAGYTDAYSLHRLVYGLFDDVRSETDKQKGVGSGFLFADKGGSSFSRRILFISNRAPKEPEVGEVQTKEIPASFLLHDDYRFEVIVNPVRRDKKTGKLVPVKGREAIAAWLIDRAEKSWGFSVSENGLEVEKIQVLQFVKKGCRVTLEQATVRGFLHVTDRERFRKSFENGIGKGRAFGCGLLQIVPVFY